MATTKQISNLIIKYQNIKHNGSSGVLVADVITDLCNLLLDHLSEDFTCPHKQCNQLGDVENWCQGCKNDEYEKYSKSLYKSLSAKQKQQFDNIKKIQNAVKSVSSSKSSSKKFIDQIHDIVYNKPTVK